MCNRTCIRVQPFGAVLRTERVDASAPRGGARARPRGEAAADSWRRRGGQTGGEVARRVHPPRGQPAILGDTGRIYIRL